MSSNTPALINPLSGNGAATHSHGGGGGGGGNRTRQVDFIRLLRQHWLLLLIATLLGGIVGVGAYGAMRVYMPSYTTLSAVVVSPPVRNPLDPTPPEANVGEQNEFIQNEINYLLSEANLTKAMTRGDIRATHWADKFKNNDGTFDNKLAVAHLMGDGLRGAALSVEQKRNSTTVVLSLTGREKDDLKKVLAGIHETYMNFVKSRAELLNDEFFRNATQSRDNTDREITVLRDRLNNYMKQHDMPAIQQAGSQTTYSIQLLETEQSKALLDYEAAKATYESSRNAMLSGITDADPQMMAQVNMDPNIAAKREAVSSMRIQRNMMEAQTGPNNATVKNYDRQIEAAEQELKEQTDRLVRERQQLRIDGAKSMMDSMESQINGLGQKLDERRKRMADIALQLNEHESITSKIKIAEGTRNMQNQAVINAGMLANAPGAVRVMTVQSATDAELTGPKWFIWIPAITLVFPLLTMGFLFLTEMFDQRVRSPQDLATLHGDVLGIVPLATEDPSGPAQIEGVVLKDPAGLMAEAFRQLRNSVLARMDRRGYKTLLVVGAQAGSGTSSILTNLAASLAFSGRRVLVMDCNVRRPSLHKLMEVTPAPGLVDVLQGAADVEQAIHRNEDTGIDTLPAGDYAPHPELLESPAFRSLISQLESRYDLILIDTAPALVASDCMMLAKTTDAVLVVVHALTDMRGMVARVLRMFDGQRADLLGVVLNCARSSVGGYFRQNYEQFYDYRRPGPTQPALPKAPATV